MAMNRLHTKVLVYALLLANVPYIMSMDEQALTIGQLEAQQKTARFMELLNKYSIVNPINPIGSFDDAKKFAGHVVLYEVTSNDKHHFSGDLLSQYGFMFEKTHLHTKSFGYELNQLSKHENPIELRFGFDGRGRNGHPLLLSSARIFMRHVTPQEAADCRKKIESGVIKFDRNTRYSEAILDRLEYRAQQEADEAPSLYAVTTKRNVKALLSLTPEQAETFLEGIKEAYYVCDEEKNYIQDLLQPIIQQAQ